MSSIFNSNFLREVPVFFQTEKMECGAACVAMIAHYYDRITTIQMVRQYNITPDYGASVRHLIEQSSSVNMSAKAYFDALESLDTSLLPAILFVDDGHYIVLTKIRKNSFSIIDPSFGKQNLSTSELKSRYSGCYLVLRPINKIKRSEVNINKITIKSVLGNVYGLNILLMKFLFISIGIEALSIVIPMFSEWVFDLAIPSGDYDLLTTLAIVFAILSILQQVISFMRVWLLSFIGNIVNQQWKSNVITKLISLNFSFFQRNFFGDILSRFESVESINKFVSGHLITSVFDAIMALITFIMMLIYCWKLALASLTSLILYAIIRFMRISTMRTSAMLSIRSRAVQESYLMETLRGMKSIKLFLKEDERSSNWESLVKNEQNANFYSNMRHSIYSAINSSLISIEKIIIVWWGANIIMSGSLTIGALIAFLSYRDQVDKRFGNLIDTLCEYKSIKTHLYRLSDIMTFPSEIKKSLFAEKTHLPSLYLKNIYFRYPGSPKNTVRGVSFHLPAGSHTAITGRSGSGKTTIANIILGIINPDSGEIIVDKTRLKPGEVPALREITASVMQDDNLFEGSILQNISFFSPNCDREFVEKCAQSACIHEEIIMMPRGYNTPVGDMGASLSGGQKQRIMLARALYKKPMILLMDEATSHLDIDLERKIIRNLSRLKITKISISHRKETILSCDRCILIDGGKSSEIDVSELSTQ